MERKPFVLSEHFSGNLELFNKVLKNKNSIFVYDVDGIISNSPKKVFSEFTKKTGVGANPVDINEFEFLETLARNSGLAEEIVNSASDGWYDPQTLLEAERYMYIKPAIRKTIEYYGASNIYVLTSRNPGLTESTLNWLKREVPGILPQNVLIRGSMNINSVDFKVQGIMALSKIAPWVIFIDDDPRYVKGVLESPVQNCLVIGVPIGQTVLDVQHERFVKLKRYPHEHQGMYPFMAAVNQALSG